MKVLVTGGTGVVGAAVTTELLRRGHVVRLLSRNASRDAEQWEDVEAWDGDLAESSSLHGAADGCDVVVHAAGAVRARNAEATLDDINVAGTRVMVAEAARARVTRFIYISSLGADSGASEYHRTKRDAEAIVAEFPGIWSIVRLGNVYGPHDEVLSVFLQLVRTLPVLPVVEGDDRPFQPIWHEDAGRALASLAEDASPPDCIALAGPERTTLNAMIDRFEELTDRHPLRIPFPAFIAELGLSATEAAGIELPFNSAALAMYLEGNYLEPGEENALVRYGIAGTALDDGLRLLITGLPEKPPDEGRGPLIHRRVRVHIDACTQSADSLFERFRSRFNDFVPIDAMAEPGADQRIDVGETLTLALPLRGNIQVRAQKVEDGEITLATLDGHPLAGVVHFRFRQDGERVCFEIDVYDRAANFADRLGMLLGGNLLQQRTWKHTAQRVVEASGGTTEGIEHETDRLDDAQAERIEVWARNVIYRRMREQERST